MTTEELIVKIQKEIKKDVNLANGEDEEAHNERHWADRIERQAQAFRKILTFTGVLRADYRDNDADYLIGLLADIYEIER